MSLHHTHPAVTHVRIPGLDGIREVVLRHEHEVVVVVSYADDLPEAIALLGTLDCVGNGLARVPVTPDLKFLTWDEAESVERAEQVDQDMLGWAHG